MKVMSVLMVGNCFETGYFYTKMFDGDFVVAVYCETVCCLSVFDVS